MLFREYGPEGYSSSWPEEKVRLLLEAHPEAAKETYMGRFPLSNAVWGGASEAVIRQLLDAHPEAAKKPCKRGNFPLHHAIKAPGGAYLDVVRLLLDAHPEAAKERDPLGRLPLHLAVHIEASEAVIQLLLDAHPGAAKEANIQEHPLFQIVRMSWRYSEALLNAIIEASSGVLDEAVLLEAIQIAPDKNTFLGLVSAALKHGHCHELASARSNVAIAAWCTISDLDGLSHIVTSGLTTLPHFSSAVDALLGMKKKYGKSAVCRFRGEFGWRRVRPAKVLRTLRIWHHGGRLWSLYLLRLLANLIARPAAKVVVAFLCGQCGCERCCRQPLQLTHENGDDALEEAQEDVVATQHCEHGEPPAQDDPSNEIVLEEMWAQTVERHILAGSHLTGAADDDAGTPLGDGAASWSSDVPEKSGMSAPQAPFGEYVYLLQCTRGGAKLHGALDRGRALDSVRVNAAACGQSCVLGPARIFVHQDQYDEVVELLSLHKLQAHQVVVSEAFFPLVREEIAALPSRANIRLRSVKPLAVATGSDDVIPVKRTFLQSSPRLNRQIATQSDSQAQRFANPRV